MRMGVGGVGVGMVVVLAVCAVAAGGVGGGNGGERVAVKEWATNVRGGVPVQLAGARTSAVALAVEAARRAGMQPFRRANLVNANFTGLNLSKIDFTGAWLDGAVLDSTILNDVSFRNASLIGASLRGAVGRFVDFTDADLTSAVFERAVLHGSLFARSSLVHTSIVASDISRSDVTGARIDNATISDTNVDYALFDGAIITSSDVNNLRGKTVLCGGGHSSSSCALLTDAATYKAAIATPQEDKDMNPNNPSSAASAASATADDHKQHITAVSLTATDTESEKIAPKIPDDAEKPQADTTRRLRPKQAVKVRMVPIDANPEPWSAHVVPGVSAYEKEKMKRQQIIYNKGTILDAYLLGTRAFEVLRASAKSASMASTIRLTFSVYLPASIAIVLVLVTTLYVLVASPDELSAKRIEDVKRAAKASAEVAETNRRIRESWLEPLDDVPIAFAVDMKKSVPSMPTIGARAEEASDMRATKSKTTARATATAAAAAAATQMQENNEAIWAQARDAAAQNRVSGIIESLSALSDSLGAAEKLLELDNSTNDDGNDDDMDQPGAVAHLVRGNVVIGPADEDEDSPGAPKSTTRPNTPVTPRVEKSKLGARDVLPLSSFSVYEDEGDDNNKTDVAAGMPSSHAPTSPMPEALAVRIPNLPMEEKQLMTTLRSLTPRRLRKISVAAYRTAHDMETKAADAERSAMATKEAPPETADTTTRRGVGSSRYTKPVWTSTEAYIPSSRRRGVAPKMKVFTSPLFDDSAAGDGGDKSKTTTESTLSRAKKSKKPLKSPLGKKDINRL